MQKHASNSCHPLLLVYAAIGTGALEYLHHLHHEHEDALVTAEFVRTHPGQPADQVPEHDDNNCEFHRVMHAPLMTAGFVPLLICLWIFVAFLSQLTPQLVPQFTVTTSDSRGPPVV